MFFDKFDEVYGIPVWMGHISDRTDMAAIAFSPRIASGERFSINRKNHRSSIFFPNSELLSTEVAIVLCVEIRISGVPNVGARKILSKRITSRLSFTRYQGVRAILGCCRGRLGDTRFVGICVYLLRHRITPQKKGFI